MRDGAGDIDDGVRALLADRLGLDRHIDADATLRDAGLDSAGLLSLVVGLEEAFDVEIGDDAITEGNFATVRAIGTYVAGRVGP